jgi:Dyp-type peroxidase family
MASLHELPALTSLTELTVPIPRTKYIPPEKRPSLRKALESLQGNILQGHGRDHSVQIFLHFKDKKEADVKNWIKVLAQYITSAQQQLVEIEQYRQYEIPGRSFMSFFLSASGYRYILGLDSKKHPSFDDKAFLYSMKAAQHRLNDPPEKAWEKEYQNDLHAMLLLADDNESVLLWETHKWLGGVKAYAEICAVEHGRVMRNAQGDSIEHFGFADSGSQPLFFQSDIERKRQKKDRTNVWELGVGPHLVLVPDPYGEEKDASTGKVVHRHSGSYLVFRKLAQNVRKFKENEQKLAAVLGLTGEDAKRAGALVMGRFADGTPVVLQPTAGRPSNNFTYADDPDGEKCPLQAHIRKANPRTPGTPRIVRRGITYGKRWKEPKDNPSLEELPEADVGLLFMSYQKDIERQFEFLQLAWANNPRFPVMQAPGIDPVIGQPGGMGAGQQKWPTQWNELREKHKPFDFHGAVTLQGGEYFFAPSIFSLKEISNWK